MEPQGATLRRHSIVLIISWHRGHTRSEGTRYRPKPHRSRKGRLGSRRPRFLPPHGGLVTSFKSSQSRRDAQRSAGSAPARAASLPGRRLGGSAAMLARVSHQLTVEARDKPANTSLCLLAALNVGFKNVGARHAVPEVAERRAPRTDGLFTHCASPRGGKAG